MRSSFSLVHPRRALRRLLDEYATGRRSRLLEGIRSLPASGTRRGCCMDWLDRSSPRSVWRSAQPAASRRATSAWP